MKRCLDGILQSYQQTREDRSTAEALRIVERSDVTRKWDMNFMLLLLFAAGGQRPQTYMKLQAPSEGELCEMKEQASRMPFFEVKTLFEKTKRSLDMPNVLVPAHVMKYFNFDVSVMRGVVLPARGSGRIRIYGQTTPHAHGPRDGVEKHPGHILSAIISFVSCTRNEGNYRNGSLEQLRHNKDASISREEDLSRYE